MNQGASGMLLHPTCLFNPYATAHGTLSTFRMAMLAFVIPLKASRNLSHSYGATPTTGSPGEAGGCRYAKERVWCNGEST